MQLFIQLRNLSATQKITLIAAIITGICTIAAAFIGLGVPVIQWMLENRSSEDNRNPIRLETRLSYEEFVTGSVFLGDPKLKPDLIGHINGNPSLSGVELSELLISTDIQTCESFGAAILELGVTNTASGEQIRFESLPIVRIVDLKPLEFFDTVHVVYEASAGAGEFHEYTVELMKSELEKGQIVQPDYIGPATIPDFFTLQQGEQEWLKLFINCMEPGKYVLQIGIDYSYDGSHDTTWGNDVISLLAPDKYYSWTRVEGLLGPNTVNILDSFVRWNTTREEKEYIPATLDQWLP